MAIQTAIDSIGFLDCFAALAITNLAGALSFSAAC
jgi:hypothetical protein